MDPSFLPLRQSKTPDSLTERSGSGCTGPLRACTAVPTRPTGFACGQGRGGRKARLRRGHRQRRAHSSTGILTPGHE